MFLEGLLRYGGVNEEGIIYYNNFINELFKNGIRKLFVCVG